MLDLLEIELQIKWSVFTLLVCPSSCSSNLHAVCLGPLQTALKWFSLPHSSHVLLYAGHLLGGWMYPQYQHGLTGLIILLSVCSISAVCVLRASACLTHIRTWSLVLLLDLLMILSLLSIFLCMY